MALGKFTEWIKLNEEDAAAALGNAQPSNPAMPTSQAAMGMAMRKNVGDQSRQGGQFEFAMQKAVEMLSANGGEAVLSQVARYLRSGLTQIAKANPEQAPQIQALIKNLTTQRAGQVQGQQMPSQAPEQADASMNASAPQVQA